MFDPSIVVGLLATGFVKVHDVKHPTAHVRQDIFMPNDMRRALSLLSMLYLHEGKADQGSCIHEVMERANHPLKDWDLDCFKPPFEYAEVVLVDGALGVPTNDCYSLYEGGGEEELTQAILFNSLKSSLAHLKKAKAKKRAYSALREFIVRNPVVHFQEIRDFALDNGLLPSLPLIESFYRPLPFSARRRDGSVYLCKHCNAVLWEDNDKTTYPEGRCRIRQCAQENAAAKSADTISEPAGYRIAQNEILAYWVGPGLDEVRIFDALKAEGLDAIIYPNEDETDVGVDGRHIGIDAKSYSSPMVLARKLTQSIGGLAGYRNRFVAVPDSKQSSNPDYLRALRENYTGSQPVKFCTTFDTIKHVKILKGVP
jgi:hypothetical protein